MKLLVMALVLALTLVLMIPQDAFSLDADDLSLEGSGLGKNKESSIYLDFADNKLKNAYLTISKDGETEKLVLENPKVKIKENYFIIIDEKRNLVLGKQKDTGNYVLISKIKLEGEKQRILFKSDNPDAKTGQSAEKPKPRDFAQEFEAQKLKVASQELAVENAKEKKAREKQDRLEKQALEFQKRQEDILTNKDLQKQEKEKEQSALIKKLIAQNAEKIQNKSGEQLRKEIVNKDRPVPSPIKIVIDDRIKILVQNPRSVEYKNEFALSGFIFNPKINKNNDYNFNDGKINDVKISGKIKKVGGDTVHSFSEITSNSGYFSTTYYVPENSDLGEYSVIIDAEKTINSKVVTDKLTKSFFVNDIQSTPNDTPVIDDFPDTVPASLYVSEPTVFTLTGSDLDGDTTRWTLSSNITTDAMIMNQCMRVEDPCITQAIVGKVARYDGVMLDVTAATFSWTPGDEHDGDITAGFTFTLIDSGRAQDSETVAIKIDPNNLPTFTPYIQTLSEGDDVTSLSTVVTNPDEIPPDTTSNYDITGGNLPPSIIELLNHATGAFTGPIPSDAVSAKEDPATYETLWTFRDGTGTSKIQQGILTVNNKNQPPIIDPIQDTIPRTYSEFDIISFNMSGFDPDTNDPLPTWSVSDNSTSSTGATIHPENGTFLWIPGDQYGNSTTKFTFTLTDAASEPVIETIALRIEETELTSDDEPPEFARYSQTVLEGQPIPSLSIAVRDPAEDSAVGTISYTLESDPPLPDNVRDSFDDTTGDFGGSFPFNTTGSDPGFVQYDITWTYTDDSGALPSEESGTITVNNDNRAPEITPPDGINNTPAEFDTVSYDFEGMDPDTDPDTGEAAPTWGISPNNDGAIINPATGAFLWIPGGQYDEGDTVSFNITLTDPIGTRAIEEIDFTVSDTPPTIDNEPPRLSDYHAGVSEGNRIPPLSNAVSDPFEIPANGTITYAIIQDGTDLPDNIRTSLDPRTGVFSAIFPFSTTDHSNPTRDYAIKWTYHDGVNPVSSDQSGTLTVTNENRRPMIDAISNDINRTPQEHEIVSFVLDGMDPDTDDADPVWAVQANATTNAIIHQDGTFSWTPDDTHGGTAVRFVFTLTDSEEKLDTETIKFDVVEVNVAPERSQPYNVSVDEGDTITTTLSSAIDDPVEIPPSTITYTLDTGQTLPPGITLSRDGLLSGTVSHNAVSAGALPQNLTFTWTYNDDGIGPNANITQTSSITVTDVPIVVAPDDGSSTSTEGDPVTIDLEVSGDGDITCTSTSTIPADLTFNTACTITGNLDRDAITNGETSQEFTINYMAQNPDGVSDSGTYVLTVNDRPPTFGTYEEILSEGQPLPSLYDSAVVNAALTPASTISSYEIINDSLPSGITDLFDMTTGEFNGSIPFDIVTFVEGSQIFNFEWRFTDAIGVSGVQMGTLTVNNFNQEPVIEDIPDASDRTVDQGSTLTFTLSDGDLDGDDVDGDWAISSENLGANIGVTSGIFTWTPTDEHVGTQIFTITLTDQDGREATADIKVIIN